MFERSKNKANISTKENWPVKAIGTGIICLLVRRPLIRKQFSQGIGWLEEAHDLK